MHDVLFRVVTNQQHYEVLRLYGVIGGKARGDMPINNYWEPRDIF